jgi:hypothetical protein
MKPFLKNIFTFSIFPLICLLIGIVSTYYISTKIDYRLNPAITDLYMGDSHIECAVNDSLLKTSKNISTASESFYFTFYKLKKIVEENKKIENVYLGFSYHSLSNYYDKFISGEYSSSISPKYFHTLPVKEQIRLIYWNFKNLSSFIKDLGKINYKYLSDGTTFSFGGYLNNFYNTVPLKTSMEKRLQFQFYTDKKLNDFSDINLLYLTKIINICKINKINLLILNTPLHAYYESKIPENYIDKYNEIVKLNNLKVINFKDLSFSDSCFIPDGDHLSVKGAYQVTNELLRIKNKRTIEGLQGWQGE